MPIVEADGARLNCLQLGSEGSAVVMIHGLVIDSLATWYFSVGPRLAKKHKVTLYDLRGHGRSERPAQGYDLNSMVDDLECVVRDLSSDVRTLVGYSYGCAVALRYAVRHPEAVDRLVLIEGPLPFFSEEWTRQMLQKSLDGMLAMLPEKHRQTFTKLLDREDGRPSQLFEQVHGLVEDTSLLSDMARDPDLSDEELSAVQCPALLIYGEGSTQFHASRDRLLRLLPKARLEMVPGGHFVIMDNVSRIADLCEQFVDE